MSNTNDAPERLWAAPSPGFGWEDIIGGNYDAGLPHCVEYIRADLVPAPAVPDDVASLSAAREAAAVERAFRDGLAYASNVRVKDHDQAWQQSLARERLGDTTALDRLIAERVREERERMIDAIRDAWHAGGPNMLGDILEAALGSKEGQP